MKYFPLFIIIFLLLLTRLFFYFEDKIEYKEGDTVSIEHIFRQEPKKSEFGQYFFINNLMVGLPPFPLYEYGDKILIKGEVKVTNSQKGELLILSRTQVEKIKDSSSLLMLLKPIRERILSSVQVVLPSKEGGLLLGILLGVRDRIDADYYDQLRSAGVLHVIAASGQNVTILALLLMSLCEILVRRKFALILTVAGISFYALLTGFDPPIVRASLMAILTFGALFFGRQSQSLYILMLTALVMLFVSPSLIEDVSFILSFLSTLGIIIFNPILNGFLKFKNLSLLKEDIVTTISSQIATFPILLAFFQSYSLLSLPVNFLVVWTVPFIMVLAGIGAIFSLIHPVLGMPFYLVSYPLLYYFRLVVEVFSDLGLNFTVSSFPNSILVGYYLIFGVFIIKRRHSNKNA